MKQEEMELLIIRSQIEVARDRVESLEAKERGLLLALGRDPDNPGIRFEVKTKKDFDAALAFFRSPEFAKQLQAYGDAFQKALLNLQRRQFKELKGWKPLFGDRAATARVRGRVKAGSAFK